MTPNRPLDQQPVLPDQEDIEEIDTILGGSDWHRVGWRIEYVVAEGTHDTARFYTRTSLGYRLSDEEDRAIRFGDLSDAVDAAVEVTRQAESLGALIRPLVRSRRVAVIATEYVTER